MSGVYTDGGGGHTAAPFKHIYFVDFEYQVRPGGLPDPLCMVAKDAGTGEIRAYWRDDLRRLAAAPFDVSSNSLFVAYYAPAELSCFLALGWQFPAAIVDAFVEHRVETNGLHLPAGNGLIGALACRGLPHIDGAQKDSMRSLVLDRWHWSSAERQSILSYCASDVSALESLFAAMAPAIDWPRALLRGRFMAAVARMEQAGVPIDLELLHELNQHWPDLKEATVRSVATTIPVFDELVFKADRFARWLSDQAIAWPHLPSGQLKLDDDTFKERARLHPQLEALRDVRRMMGQLRATGLDVGPDGRSRTLLSPFRAKTGRNQPSASSFAFGPARWLRGLIKPPPGYGVAYIDFSSQEIGLAAGLSGDEALIHAYERGDPYIAFAIQAGLAPEDATKETHPIIRERCKAVVLGMNYGMGIQALAFKAGISIAEASDLIRLHKKTYRKFWRWSDDSTATAFLTNEMSTVFGWRRRITHRDKTTSVLNFPMQANGAEMMRIAAIAATEAGIEVCAPVHDAFLIGAPAEKLDEHAALMQQLMGDAGRAVTGGLAIRTEARFVRWPDRYMDERGTETWNRVMTLLAQIKEN